MLNREKEIKRKNSAEILRLFLFVSLPWDPPPTSPLRRGGGWQSESLRPLQLGPVFQAGSLEVINITNRNAQIAELPFRGLVGTCLQ